MGLRINIYKIILDKPCLYVILVLDRGYKLFDNPGKRHGSRISQSAQ